jgi:hypothetical protein
MYTVAAHFPKNAPASAANVNARRLRPTPIDTVRRAPNGRHLWIAGLPIAPGRDLARVLDTALDGDLAATVATLTSLDGAFAAFVWDSPSRKFVIVTDFAGIQPVYMRHTSDGLAVAPTVRELADGAEPDPAGWGAFVGFGHFIGERTSVAGVTRVDRAAVLEYEPETNRLSTRTYWRWPDVNPRITEADLDTEQMLRLLEANVTAYEPYGTRGTLLLSGGYESRLLAALLDRTGSCPSALTLRNPYEHFEIDGRFAARISRLLGIPHRVQDPDPDFFSTDKFLEYVTLSDVGTTSVNLFIAQVYAELEKSGAQATWDGVGYGIVIKDKSAPSFEAFFKKALKPRDSATWEAARRVFAPAFVDAMWTQVHETMAAEVARCHEGPAGVAEYFVRNRARNRTTPNAVKVYANHVLPFMPGLTKAFYECLVPIPPKFKAGDALYRRILDRHFPALARVPYCSGGHPLPGTRPDLEYRFLAARGKVIQHPRVGHVLRRVGVMPVRPESAKVRYAVRSADANDGVLNADGVRELQRTQPTGRNDDTLARELVFYWSMWREMATHNRLSGAALSA